MPATLLFSTAVHDRNSRSGDERVTENFERRKLATYAVFPTAAPCSKLVTLKPVIFTFVIPSEANDLCTLWPNRRGQRGLAAEFLFQNIFTGKPLRLKMLAGSDRVRLSKVLRMNILKIKKEGEKVLAGRSRQIETSGCEEQWAQR
jgi:hypothetical protein